MSPRGDRRAVVTGVGMVTPLGLGVEATWAGLMEGRSAIGPIRAFEAENFPVRFAAEAPDPGTPADVPDPVAHLVQDKKGRLTVAALREAVSMSGLDLASLVPERVGVSMGSEAARPALGQVADRLDGRQPPTRQELERSMPDAPTVLVAALCGASGPLRTISTACTSSCQAVGEAMLDIRRGAADVVIAGGADVLVDPIMVTGFSLLGALSTRNDAPARASRPFDLERDGFVLGEGAGFLVMESLAHARARGATILGEVRGYGCSLNAYRITDSPPDGRGAAQAMRLAMEDAGLRPAQVGYVNAHGTSTAMNDASETRGIRQAFGDAADALAVSSSKSMMGHLVAACGAVEAIVALWAVRQGRLPPTINLDHPDPACDLDYVPNHARDKQVDHALSNAFGFGGSNGSVVLSRFVE